jgi:hypothetical protein
MTQVNSIKQLDSAIENGNTIFWFSKFFEISLEIDKINKTTYSYNFIQCRLKSIDGIQTIRLQDIYIK